MIENFFILGFLLSLTPGPVLFQALQMGLVKDQALSHFLTGTYLGVCVIASVTLTGINLFTLFPYSRMIFILMNASILIYVGTKSLKTQHKHFRSRQPKKHSHPFLNGFLISITSPSRWAVWVSTASLIASSSDNALQTVFYGATFAIGSVVFFIFLAFFAERLASHIKKGTFTYISRFAGMAIIGFAVISLLQI